MPEMHTQDLLHFRGPRKRAKMFHSSKFDTFTKKRIGQPAQLSGFLMEKQKIKKLGDPELVLVLVLVLVLG